MNFRDENEQDFQPISDVYFQSPLSELPSLDGNGDGVVAVVSTISYAQHHPVLTRLNI